MCQARPFDGRSRVLDDQGEVCAMALAEATEDAEDAETEVRRFASLPALVSDENKDIR